MFLLRHGVIDSASFSSAVRYPLHCATFGFEALQSVVVASTDFSGVLPLMLFGRGLNRMLHRFRQELDCEIEFADPDSQWKLIFQRAESKVIVSELVVNKGGRGPSTCEFEEFAKEVMTYVPLLYKECCEVCPVISEDEEVRKWYFHVS
jgi:hypothetical protein